MDKHDRALSGNNPELAELAAAIRELTRRVERLERMAAAPGAPPPRQVVTNPAQHTLESRLGSQYLNRAGVIALLVGVSFAVHWAFSNDWIGAGAIIAAGLVGGLAIIGLGEWFKLRQYAGFGLSLQALGIGALYVVLWAGFQVYRVVPALAALAGMILVTAATAAASVAQDSELLAVFAFLGGFTTPFLLSTGQNRQAELFAYLLVLSSGMLVSVALRRWSRLLAVSFFACVAVNIAWFLRYYAANEWLATFIFVTILFAIFIAASLLTDSRSKSIPVVVPTATAAYLSAAYITVGSGYIGMVEVLLAAGLLVVTWNVASRLRPLYSTVAMACAAFSVPAEFDPHWTTSALWLAFGLVLMVVGFRKSMAFVRWDALILIGFTVLKVFVFDLARLAPGYRILAMAVLGIALLAISFVYQRNWLRLRRQ